MCVPARLELGPDAQVGEGSRWQVAGGGRRWQVAWHAAAEEHPGIAEVIRLGVEGSAVFDFAEPLTVRGVLDDLGHDLRDFLRRATWLFPYEEDSRGLVPERFARLLG